MHYFVLNISRFTDGITVLRMYSDPESISESEVAFHRWIGWSGGNLRRTKSGTGVYFLFLFLATTGVHFEGYAVNVVGGAEIIPGKERVACISNHPPYFFIVFNKCFNLMTES